MEDMMKAQAPEETAEPVSEAAEELNTEDMESVDGAGILDGLRGITGKLSSSILNQTKTIGYSIIGEAVAARRKAPNGELTPGTLVDAVVKGVTKAGKK